MSLTAPPSMGALVKPLAVPALAIGTGAAFGLAQGRDMYAGRPVQQKIGAGVAFSISAGAAAAALPWVIAGAETESLRAANRVGLLVASNVALGVAALFAANALGYGEEQQ